MKKYVITESQLKTIVEKYDQIPKEVIKSKPISFQNFVNAIKMEKASGETDKGDLKSFVSAKMAGDRAKNYLNKTDYNLDDLNLRNITNVDTTEGLVSTSRNSEMWIKSGYTKNLFLQNFNITQSNGKTNILNTPYFHKQLYSDFTNGRSYGKYAGSAYLLLNSLPLRKI